MYVEAVILYIRRKKEYKSMISVDEAREKILEHIQTLKVQSVNLMDSLGCALAGDITSNINVPPFDNSAMDGYAIIAADSKGATRENPVKLKVSEDIAAGYVGKTKVENGTAIRIMTGAPMPEGADTVIMVEKTSPQNGWVNIFEEVKKGENIRLAGEDVKKGEIVINRGKTIRAADIGMLATLGISKVEVRKAPRVAIISTGDELVEIDEELSPGKIRNSNAYSIAAQVIEAGGDPVIIGIARDTAQDIAEKINAGVSSADVLITSGGVSVGDYDIVKDVLQNAGEMIFWKVAMKPAKPLAFGIIQNKPVFGLPGNPSSSMISFEQFVRPSIKKMAGHDHILRPVVSAVVDSDIKKKPGRKYFIRVKLYRRGHNLHADLSGGQGSGMIKSMTKAQGLLIVPEEAANIPASTKLDVQVLYPDDMDLSDTGEQTGAVEETIKKKSGSSQISCEEALQIADITGKDPSEIGKTANELRIKIKKCMLGCF